MDFLYMSARLLVFDLIRSDPECDAGDDTTFGHRDVLVLLSRNELTHSGMERKAERRNNLHRGGRDAFFFASLSKAVTHEKLVEASARVESPSEMELWCLPSLVSGKKE
jgi:hypothetical protein